MDEQKNITPKPEAYAQQPEVYAQRCPNCNGRGHVGYEAKPCPTCGHTDHKGIVYVPMKYPAVNGGENERT